MFFGGLNDSFGGYNLLFEVVDVRKTHKLFTCFRLGGHCCRGATETGTPRLICGIVEKLSDFGDIRTLAEWLDFTWRGDEAEWERQIEALHTTQGAFAVSNFTAARLSMHILRNWVSNEGVAPTNGAQVRGCRHLTMDNAPPGISVLLFFRERNASDSSHAQFTALPDQGGGHGTATAC